MITKKQLAFSQNGLPLVPDVAVLIQEMIQSDIAGVMFTCDPMSCHTGKIVINACRGVGEVRVSAASFNVIENIEFQHMPKFYVCKCPIKFDLVQCINSKQSNCSFHTLGSCCWNC